MQAASRSLRPTRIRWFVLSLVVLIMLVESLQRASLGIAGKLIQDEFLFSTQKMGWILSAFSLGQALFQIPWGYAGDRYGPRGVLTLAVLCSAVSTAAIGLTPRVSLQGWFGIASLLIILRFLTGVGMAAAPLNSNKIVSVWMAPSERGVGSSAIPFGAGLGSLLAPTFIAWVMQRWGWRTSFYLCGAIAVAVALVWRLFVTNTPGEDPRVNAVERELLRRGREEDVGADIARRENRPRRRPPWGKMLRNRSLWVISLSFSCQQYAITVFYTWFFIYLVRVRGLTLTRGGLWGSTPFIAMILLSPVGGWISDRTVGKLGKRRGRQGAVWLGMGCSAILLWVGSNTANNLVAIPLLAAAAGFNYFAVPSFWATCIDLAPDFGASVSSMMNTCGSLGGWLAPVVTAFVATHWGWTAAVDFAALVTAVSGLLWLIVDPNQSIETGGISRSRVPTEL
ncbi:MAG: MFS transporter [Terriglobia bacterium]